MAAPGSAPPISIEEQLRRENWITYFRSSSAIEGLTPDDATRRIEEAYIRGDLSETAYSDELARLSGTQPYDHQAIADLKAAFERGEMPAEVFMARFTEMLGPR
jgi:hypothetical protein